MKVDAEDADGAVELAGLRPVGLEDTERALFVVHHSIISMSANLRNLARLRDAT
jgi:hypothetical protein